MGGYILGGLEQVKEQAGVFPRRRVPERHYKNGGVPPFLLSFPPLLKKQIFLFFHLSS